jgi:hypothetical protein
MAARFPPPWSLDELEACFVVKDGAGQKLATIYFAVTLVTSPMQIIR